MNFNESLLENDFEKKIINKKKEESNTRASTESYGVYDAFHSANIFSSIFFCWVNKLLRVISFELIRSEKKKN